MLPYCQGPSTTIALSPAMYASRATPASLVAGSFGVTPDKAMPMATMKLMGTYSTTKIVVLSSARKKTGSSVKRVTKLETRTLLLLIIVFVTALQFLGQKRTGAL